MDEIIAQQCELITQLQRRNARLKTYIDVIRERNGDLKRQIEEAPEDILTVKHLLQDYFVSEGLPNSPVRVENPILNQLWEVLRQWK